MYRYVHKREGWTKCVTQKVKVRGDKMSQVQISPPRQKGWTTKSWTKCYRDHKIRAEMFNSRTIAKTNRAGQIVTWATRGWKKRQGIPKYITLMQDCKYWKICPPPSPGGEDISKYYATLMYETR